MKNAFLLPDSAYFLSHSVGCLPKVSQQRLAENYFTPWQQQGGDAWPVWLQKMDEFNLQLSQLLGGNPQDYCPQSNLSSGFTKWLTALPADSKRNQVLMHRNAFPSMGFVIKGLSKLGFELVLVEEESAENDIEIWQRYMSERTLCTLLTHVHSNTGVLTDISPLASLCRENGSYCVVDIAQSVGVVPIDIMQWQVDAVFGSCVKWLCGGPGAGFMWVSPLLLPQLEPIDVGWFSHSNPFEMDIDNFDYADNSKRFWGGTPSVASYLVATSSIELISAIGVAKIWQHNRTLVNSLLTHLPEQIASQVDTQKSGGTLCLSAQGSTIESVWQHLSANKVHCDRRQNTLRLSLHIYNNEDELNYITDAFSSVIK